MKIIDAWGNEFDSEEDAEEFWTRQWWRLLDAERFADCFHLDIKIANWIMKSELWYAFQSVFRDRFDAAIKDYIDDCYYESEVTE